MPILKPVAFVGKSDTPFVWTGSACGEVLALERMTPKPTLTEGSALSRILRGGRCYQRLLLVIKSASKSGQPNAFPPQSPANPLHG
jgi:hypothetical protein